MHEALSRAATRSRFAVLASAILIVGTAALLLFVISVHDGRRQCAESTHLMHGGRARLGSLVVTGFDDEHRAHVSLRQGEARLFAQRTTMSGSVQLRAEECASGASVKLIAIGAPRPISLPTQFPLNAARSGVTLESRNDWYAIIAYPPPGAHWRLVATGDDWEASAAIVVNSE